MAKKFSGYVGIWFDDSSDLPTSSFIKRPQNGAHVTLAFKPTKDSLDHWIQGESVQVEVLGEYKNEQNHSLLVAIPDRIHETQTVSEGKREGRPLHITLGWASDGRAANSGFMMTEPNRVADGFTGNLNGCVRFCHLRDGILPIPD